MIKILHIK